MAPDDASAATAQTCSCGRTIEPDHQFCPACGRPRSDAAASDDGGGADGSLLLLGRAGGPAGTETTVRTGPGLVPRAVGLGLVLVGVVLIWSLFRQPSGEVAPELGRDEEAAADTEPDGADTGTDDGAERPDDTDDTDEEDAPATTRSSNGSTSSDPSGDGSGLAPNDEPVPPLLGEEVGLMLAVARDGRSVLEVLDLDSGQETELLGVRGRPIGAIDDWLLVIDDNNGSIIRLDLDDLEAEPIEIGGSADEFLEVIEVTEDRIWTFAETDDGPVLRALDVDGEVVEEQDFPLYSVFGFGPWSLVRPSELLYDPAGGLYRRSDDGYELVAEGQVLAAGERIAVVRQCDDGLDCDLRWYDIRSSGVIGFPAPPPADGQGFYQLLGGDRWLAHIDWRNGEGVLIEVATARVARELTLDSFFGFGPSTLAVSSDGRWMTEVVDGMLVVIDLDSGDLWPTGFRGAGAQVMFVER